MDHTLSAEAISKKYKNRPVVRKASLDLQSGQVVGLLGPNGAGKTTMFYMFAGLTDIDSGRVSLNDVDISNTPMHDRVKMGLGYLPQGVSVFRRLSAADNIRVALEVREDLDAAGVEEELERLIGRLSIERFRDTPGVALSGGECRRVEFARTLATAPKFILLDEPFVGMDPLLVSDVQKIITDLAESGIGLMITDHNVRETLQVCDYAYIMKDGEIFARGVPEEILADKMVQAYYLGSDFCPI